MSSIFVHYSDVFGQIGEVVGFVTAVLAALLMVRVVVFVEKEQHKWNVPYDNTVCTAITPAGCVALCVLIVPLSVLLTC